MSFKKKKQIESLLKRAGDPKKKKPTDEVWGRKKDPLLREEREMRKRGKGKTTLTRQARKERND